MAPPLTVGEITFLLVTILTLCTLLWLVPSCGDPACSTAHTGHMVKARAEDIERIHATYHDPLRPQHDCSLCMKRRLDE